MDCSGRSGGETHAGEKKDKKKKKKNEATWWTPSKRCCLKRSGCCLSPTPVYFLKDSRKFYQLLSPVLLLISSPCCNRQTPSTPQGSTAAPYTIFKKIPLRYYNSPFSRYQIETIKGMLKILKRMKLIAYL
ncbi:hypothetical protein LAZ67_3002998 [Cordylochernes scorpioides]|uniref:Uncharacterized protein n=1 Tax=Cordylochernes scorpioides TaxID=51811 RepID=A0ABY6K9Z2_9ARAC|nr:hypothetical protein LAZ67_3002998 [Cordylochernes scorpioides]